MANSVVHFEIFASEVERARQFYERTFGWRFEAAGPPDFYLLTTALALPGILLFWYMMRSGMVDRALGTAGRSGT